MAKDNTFDIVSEIDMQEVDNAVNQTRKEITQRYDFKGSAAEISLNGQQIETNSANEYQVSAILDILQSKFVKRGLDIRALSAGKIEPAAGGRYKQKLDIQAGISKEKAKEIVAIIKKSGLKVQSQIQDDTVRVSGKNRDDLQAVIAELKERDLDIPLQFVNFRS